MNCEKCKNKIAAVFYADDTGGRHSLCESCAAILGHIGRYEPSAEEKEQAPDSFIPECRLSALSPDLLSLPIYSSQSETAQIKCQYCSCTLDSAISTGEVGCSECYSIFSSFLFPLSLDIEMASGARMPQSRREDIGRIKALESTKKKLRAAIDSEDFELAAALRDEIRRLEAGKKGKR